MYAISTNLLITAWNMSLFYRCLGHRAAFRFSLKWKERMNSKFYCLLVSNIHKGNKAIKHTGKKLRLLALQMTAMYYKSAIAFGFIITILWN